MPLHHHTSAHTIPRQQFSPSRPDPNRLSRTEVSETDLYLLGAIEKLAYRVDYLEHRLKKTDQLLLQLIAERERETPQHQQTNRPPPSSTTGTSPLPPPTSSTTLGSTSSSSSLPSPSSSPSWSSSSSSTTALQSTATTAASTSPPTKRPKPTKGIFAYIFLSIYLLYVRPSSAPKKKCAVNEFQRIGESCYHIGGTNQVNWKAANSICRSVGGQLAEFETIAEFDAVISFLQNSIIKKESSKLSYWLGGLNPGLLWIWSSSARPINPYVGNTPAATGSNSTQKIGKDDVNKKPTTIDPLKAENLVEIKGNGRCLNVMYNATTDGDGGNKKKFKFEYFGEDCNVRHGYLCELQNRDLENEISRASKSFL